MLQLLTTSITVAIAVAVGLLSLAGPAQDKQSRDLPSHVQLRMVNLTGPLQPNEDLHAATKIPTELPESVFLHQSTVHVSSASTSCISRLESGGTLATVVCTGGRPLGCVSYGDRIYVADA